MSGSKDDGSVRDYQWYLFLHDSGRANEIVSGALKVEVDNTERLRGQVECADGVRRDLLRVQHAEIRIAKNAGVEFGFKVTVFVQEGESAPRPWFKTREHGRKQLVRKKVQRAA